MSLNPGWLSERFPTEVRATAAGLVYHQGAIWGAAVVPLLTYFAVNQGMGSATPRPTPAACLRPVAPPPLTR